MTTNRLDQIEARLDAASPAPWRADGLAGTLSGPMGDVAHVNMWREADAQLIAHAPVDLVDLVAFVREVEAALREWGFSDEFQQAVSDSLDRLNGGTSDG